MFGQNTGGGLNTSFKGGNSLANNRQGGASMFGQTGQQTSMFGQQNTGNTLGLGMGQQQQQNSSSSLGGNTNSMFGGQQKTGMFGGGASLGGSSMFGQQRPTNSFGSSNLFGGGQKTSLFGGGMGQQQSQFQVQQPQQATEEKRLMEIQKAYDTQSPDCRFQFIFYNKVKPEEVGYYQPPPNANRRLWEQARRNNPDPATLVPVQIAGFDDLKKRLVQHEHASTSYSSMLTDIKGTLDKMQTDHRTHIQTKIAKVRRDGIQLSHRLLKVMNKLETQKGSDLPFETTEVDYRRRLENIRRRLIKPGHFQSRVAEQSSIVNMQVDSRADMDMLKSLDEDNVRKIYEFLELQRKGLQHVNTVLTKDVKDVALIRKKLPAARRMER